MNRKVLVADDEAHIRLLIARLLEDLEEAGAEIYSAADGLEALEIIVRERPALVFLDVMMPGLNGFDVCRTVKRERHMEDVMVVLLTAKGQKGDWERGREAGADRYLTKPFNPDELLELAAAALGLA